MTETSESPDGGKQIARVINNPTGDNDVVIEYKDGSRTEFVPLIGGGVRVSQHSAEYKAQLDEDEASGR